jgi:hypothetical protein
MSAEYRVPGNIPAIRARALLAWKLCIGWK